MIDVLLGAGLKKSDIILIDDLGCCGVAWLNLIDMELAEEPTDMLID